MSKPEKEKKVKTKKEKRKKEKTPFTKEKFRKIMFGTKDDMGLLKKIAVYVILICVGFMFLSPVVKVFSTSLMSLSDLLDSAINWIPSSLNWDNYKNAAIAMDYGKAIKDSLIISLIPTIINVVVCSVIGYGFARYNFKLKGVLFAFVILSFVLPQQLILTPQYELYARLGLTGSILPFIIPTLFGQGINASIFILIAWSFFKQIPGALMEAAQIDGAGHAKQFFKIAIPTSIGALVVIFLFSFVWYWNEDYLTSLYLYNSTSQASYQFTPVVNQLGIFNSVFDQASSSAGSDVTTSYANTGMRMAATILAIAPLLLIYFILQKQFVESVDRAGITGE
ncbi:MAG: carbohydrate ABC transporter permease [Lachnospiraceae bacterium]